METLRGDPAEELLKRLNDTQNYPDEVLTPHVEFAVGGRTYYFTPGGFLYRREPRSEEIGGCFCGYLTDEAWHHRTGEV